MVNTGYSRNQAETYDEQRFTSPNGELFDRLEKQQLKTVLNKISPGSSVLEVGCGTGRFTELLCSNNHNVVATDLSPHMLEECRKRVGGDASYVRNDATSISFPDDHFDFVYSIRMLNQLPSKNYALRAIKEFIRVCTPGGKILVEFMNENSLSRFSGSDPVLLTPDMVKRTVLSTNSADIVDFSGILIGSQTLLDLTPSYFLPVYNKIDSYFCQIAPEYATRCYALIEVS